MGIWRDNSKKKKTVRVISNVEFSVLSPFLRVKKWIPNNLIAAEQAGSLHNQMTMTNLDVYLSWPRLF